MPLYDFECNKCGHVFEELVFEDDERPPCRECGVTDTARKISAPSPLKTNPFPYKIGKTMPHVSQMSKLNTTCPNAGKCGATTTLGGAEGK